MADFEPSEEQTAILREERSSERTLRSDPVPATPLYEACPRCGEVRELVELRGRAVCESCAEEGRDGDVDYWRWHWHGHDSDSLEDPPFDYQPEAPTPGFNDE